MRIIAGRFKGRSLRSPASGNIRPTSDRLRESLFNVLVHAYSDPVDGARILDLFAGTGALGLEALSRGAKFACFVEDAAEARGLIKENIETLGVAGQSKVFRRDATRMGSVHPNEPFSLIFCDPPYGKNLAPEALLSTLAGGWVTNNALFVVEERADVSVELPAGLVMLEQRNYGDTQIIFARFKG